MESQLAFDRTLAAVYRVHVGQMYRVTTSRRAARQAGLTKFIAVLCFMPRVLRMFGLLPEEPSRIRCLRYHQQNGEQHRPQVR